MIQYINMAILASGILIIITAYIRAKSKHGLFSTEYPTQVIIFGLLLGIFLSAILLRVYIFSHNQPNQLFEKASWSLLATVFAAPISLIMLYWKHIQSYDEKISTIAELLSNDHLMKRVSGYTYCERLVRSNLNLAPTIIELLCEHIRINTITRSPDPKIDYTLKYGIDRLSRIWEYHSRFWNYKTHMEPDLRYADFSKMELWGVCLRGVYLEKSNFSGCLLEKSKFHQAKLWKSNLSSANVKNADFSGAEVFGANFSSCIGLSDAQLNKMIGNRATIIPGNRVTPKTWIEWCNDKKNKNSCRVRDICQFASSCNKDEE